MKPYRMPRESFMALWRKHRKKLTKIGRMEWEDEKISKKRKNKIDLTKIENDL